MRALFTFCAGKPSRRLCRGLPADYAADYPQTMPQTTRRQTPGPANARLRSPRCKANLTPSLESRLKNCSRFLQYWMVTRARPTSEKMSCFSFASSCFVSSLSRPPLELSSPSYSGSWPCAMMASIALMLAWVPSFLRHCFCIVCLGAPTSACPIIRPLWKGVTRAVDLTMLECFFGEGWYKPLI